MCGVLIEAAAALARVVDVARARDLEAHEHGGQPQKGRVDEARVAARHGRVPQRDKARAGDDVEELAQLIQVGPEGGGA